MKKLIIILNFFILTASCVSTGSLNIPSIEAENLNYITSKTAEALTDCLDYGDKKACETTGRYLKKYPWLLTRKVTITNSQGMRQNEWDTQITSIRKRFDIIKSRYSEFTQKK